MISMTYYSLVEIYFLIIKINPRKSIYFKAMKYKSITIMQNELELHRFPYKYLRELTL